MEKRSTNLSGRMRDAAKKVKERPLIYWFIRAYVRLLGMLRRVGVSIIFRLAVLLTLNLLLYYFLEEVDNYKRYSKLILIANMAILLVFLPSVHITREAWRQRNTSPNNQYVTTVFIVIFTFILISMSVYFFFPYFTLSSTTNVSRFQKFVYLFMVVFLYMMLFLTYNDYMIKLYERISKIPLIPNPTLLHAIYNTIRFSVLYLLVCLPIDGYRLIRDILVGRYSLGKTSILIGLIVLVLFVFLYGTQLKRGILSLNRSLIVLYGGEVYLNRQVNIGWYDEVIPFIPSEDSIFKEMMYPSQGKRPGDVYVVGRGEIDLSDAGGTREVVQADEKSGLRYHIFGVLSGEVSVEETLDAFGRFLKEDVYIRTRDWLIKPFKDDAIISRFDDVERRDGESVHRLGSVESFAQRADSRRGGDGSEETESKGEESKAVEAEGRRGQDLKEYRRSSSMVHRVDYSLSFWLYIHPSNEHYTTEKNIINFANKLAICLSRDGTTLYVDLELKGGRAVDDKGTEIEMEADVNREKERAHGRVGKRVLAIDTFAQQKWNHIVVSTYADGRIYFFMNNVLVGVQDDILFDVSSDYSGHMIYLGEKGGVRGMIRDVYYYNKSMTRTDVSLLYHKSPLLV